MSEQIVPAQSTDAAQEPSAPDTPAEQSQAVPPSDAAQAQNDSAEQAASPVDQKEQRQKADWLRYQRSLAKMREREAALAAQAREIEAAKQTLETHGRVVAALKNGDLATLKSIGLDLNALNKAALEQGSPNAAMGEMKRQLEELQAEIKRRDETAREAELQQRVAAYVEQTSSTYPGLGWYRKAYGDARYVADLEAAAAQMRVTSGYDESFLQRVNDAALAHKRQLAETVADEFQPPAPSTPPPAERKPPTTVTSRQVAESSGGTRAFDKEEMRRHGLELLKRARKSGAL